MKDFRRLIAFDEISYIYRFAKIQKKLLNGVRIIQILFVKKYYSYKHK